MLKVPIGKHFLDEIVDCQVTYSQFERRLTPAVRNSLFKFVQCVVYVCFDFVFAFAFEMRSSRFFPVPRLERSGIGYVYFGFVYCAL